MLVNKKGILKYYGKKFTMQEKRYKIQFSTWYTGFSDIDKQPSHSHEMHLWKCFVNSYTENKTEINRLFFPFTEEPQY